MHAHILPEMDDGSKSVRMSLQMLVEMKRQGVSVVCATSHFYREQNDVNGFLQRREIAYNKLLNVRDENALPMILPASETAYFRDLSFCEDLPKLCIYGTNTLMLEMPFTDWTDYMIQEVESLVLDRNIRVVLVHPERFCFSKGNKNKIEKLMDLRIPLQVNAGSLIQHSTQKLALQLLKLTEFPLLGSDSHNMTSRSPNLKEGRDIVRKKLGEQYLNQIEKNCYRYILDERNELQKKIK